MGTPKDRIQFTPESNEKELLKDLAEEEGVSMSRMMGILIRRAAKEKTIESARIQRNQAFIKALTDIAKETDSSKMIEIAKAALPILRYQ